jgi:hypothetical protein
MSEWPHAAIRQVSMQYIRKHCMNQHEWRFTAIDSLDPHLLSLATLTSGELPIVSCYIDSRRWYVMSTERVFGQYEAASFDTSPLDISAWHWGDFKHRGLSEIETMRLVIGGASEIRAAYETGPASMAPIYYARFWEIKYPILHKFAV